MALQLRKFISTGCLAVLIGSLAPVRATGADVTHVVSGMWQSSDFHDPDNPGCSIGSIGSEQGGRLIMGASQRHASPMNLVVRKPSWVIPKGTTVEFRASFPDGMVMDFAGAGEGQAVTVELPSVRLTSLVHELTASSIMRLSFAGNEPPWTFDLGGTSTVITAMLKCFSDHTITDVDLPFTPVGPRRSAASPQPMGDGLLPPSPGPTARSP